MMIQALWDDQYLHTIVQSTYSYDAGALADNKVVLEYSTKKVIGSAIQLFNLHADSDHAHIANTHTSLPLVHSCFTELMNYQM